MRNSSNVFITGSAGVGKSFLLSTLIRELRAKYPQRNDVVVAASTGIAAVNIDGRTLHSFAGIGLGRGDCAKLTKKVRENGAACERWQRAKVLIIDEISMINGELFEALESIARSVRESRAPFGGIQLVRFTRHII